jgi:hypothetical protein
MADRDAATRNALDLRDTIRLPTESLAANLKTLFEDGSLRHLANIVSDHDEMLRAALGPFEEMRRAGMFDMPAYSGFENMLRQMDGFQANFRLPEPLEIHDFFRNLEVDGALKAFQRIQHSWADRGAALQQAMEAMRQPWLNAANLAQSFEGFAELQSVGQALRALPPFDERLADRLRTGLGDWQAPLCFATVDLVDPLSRTEIYLARGLDPALTAFPAAAFLEGTGIAGLRQAPPPVAARYGRGEAETTVGDDEAGFSRTNAAHDRLLRFETQLRRFIDERMSAAFGPKWTRQRVPGPMWTQWEEKRQRAREAGEPEWPLIAYADFADYVTIITRKDNWDTVFSAIFGRPMLVQESFQRLFPIRVCTMHARLITQDDELYLLVETMRLLRAMGFS